MSSKHAAIVGAGLAGRLLALEMARKDWQITIFEKDDDSGMESCSWTGAGMIAPYCEQESAEPVICEIGLRSLDLWPKILEQLPEKVFYQNDGSLVVAHPNDEDELNRLQREVEYRDFEDPVMQIMDGKTITELEPELQDRFHKGLFFPYEAQVDNWQLMGATTRAMNELGVTSHFYTEVSEIQPGSIVANGETLTFDLVCDCRGLGAQPDMKDLRGVRGELIHVTAPDVKISRPVRMMHPRYPLYIVPREDDRFVIGATKIESDDLSEISVRGTLELLSAAYALHPGFAEARIIETSTHCRPAMPDNLPRVDFCEGLLTINGMFRHGFLIAPALVEAAVSQLTTGKVEGPVAEIISFDGVRKK
ncbi:glycine oxidase ThiO [bacterium M21]|nr:glycine oxidase ThiO [bacterium M21]